jgi:hypothetical protein
LEGFSGSVDGEDLEDTFAGTDGKWRNGMMTALVEEWRKNYVWKREMVAKR